MSEPTMITLELSSENSTMIRRCCARPHPIASPPAKNRNSDTWQTPVRCLVCDVELFVMRWKLPAPVSYDSPVSMLDGDPAFD